jgi:hypothetical protein
LVVIPLKLGTIAISREVVPHPLLGDAHVIEHAGRAITAMSALDWERPTRIPVVAEPSRLPPGAGGLLLNHIAELARSAGVTALRYAGPYPTPALYRALARSYRASADEAVFTRDVVERALRVARDEVPVDFAPAPHVRVELACGHTELRDARALRAVIDRVAYEPDGSPARLVALADGWAAELWFGDSPWTRVAELDARGALAAGPHPLPAVNDRVIGQQFPRELRALIGELVADAVPAPLADDARRAICERVLAWADLGARAASRSAAGFAVHAVMWQRIAPLGLDRLALALAEALAPVVVSAILAELQASVVPAR